jgi:alkylhydroperoxidase family enzyme
MTEPAWIETIPESDADGEVKAAYEYAGDAKTGNVDHIMKVHSLNPQSMLDHENLYRTLMYGKGPLKRPQREMIGVVVSALNHCVY